MILSILTRNTQQNLSSAPHSRLKILAEHKHVSRDLTLHVKYKCYSPSYGKLQLKAAESAEQRIQRNLIIRHTVFGNYEQESFLKSHDLNKKSYATHEQGQWRLKEQAGHKEFEP